MLSSAVATPLAMVFAELMLNAMEHSRAGRVLVRTDRTDERLSLSVADDGIGFDASRADGLGLQIVVTLVREQLQGTLVIRSGGHDVWPAPADGLTQNEMATEVAISCPV